VINLFDILDRSHSGEKITDEKQWDLRVWKKAVALARDYGLKYDPNALIPMDDKMADACFQAAVVLLTEVGVLNVATKRVVRFEEEEIRKALAQAKDELILGEGRDRFTLKRRGVDTNEPVRIMAGHFACTDDVGPKLYQAMAEVQSLDIIEGFNFYGRHGGRQMEGMVHETLAARYQVSSIRKVIARAGRPGMHILFYPTSPNPAAMISALSEANGIRPTDAIEISPLSELKIESNLLAVAVATTEFGAFVNSDCASILGGFGGGPEENSVIGLAHGIQSHLTYRCDYCSMANGLPIDVEGSSLAAPLWARGMTCTAYARNIRTPCFSYVGTGPEPNNVNRWREMAAQTINAVASGVHVDVIRPGRPFRPNLFTPLEIEFCGEIASAMVKQKMPREKANEIIVEGLLPKYKPLYDTPTKDRYPLLKGKPFEELYDLDTLKPRKEHVEQYRAARQEMAELGIEFEW
jgi:methylamine---corrinoid protein Co-methyltransferase